MKVVGELEQTQDARPGGCGVGVGVLGRVEGGQARCGRRMGGIRGNVPFEGS